MNLKKATAALNKFFRRKTPRHFGNNRFLSVERQQEILAMAEAKRLRRNDARKPIYFQQIRLGLFT